MQQKNQAPMSEEQEGEVIEEEILKKLVFFPIPPFLSSAPFSCVMSFPVRSSIASCRGEGWGCRVTEEEGA